MQVNWKKLDPNIENTKKKTSSFYAKTSQTIVIQLTASALICFFNPFLSTTQKQLIEKSLLFASVREMCYVIEKLVEKFRSATGNPISQFCNSFASCFLVVLDCAKRLFCSTAGI